MRPGDKHLAYCPQPRERSGERAPLKPHPPIPPSPSCQLPGWWASPGRDSLSSQPSGGRVLTSSARPVPQSCGGRNCRTPSHTPTLGNWGISGPTSSPNMRPGACFHSSDWQTEDGVLAGVKEPSMEPPVLQKRGVPDLLNHSNSPG